MKRKYNLAGIDGNAFCIMGYVCKALKNEYKSFGFTTKQFNAIKETYLANAKSSDYNHLVAVSFEMIEKINRATLQVEECKNG